ncbi:MAG: lipopolysaccharide kinase InaA family protein [Pirellulales bacterium]
MTSSVCGQSAQRAAEPSLSRLVQPGGPADSDRGTIWTDHAYQQALAAAGLSDCASVMASQQGRLLRALRSRENWRLELHLAEGPRGMYLKKHHARGWAQRLRALARLGPGSTPGRVEADNIARLNALGITAMRLVAFGERQHEGGLVESFVLTEELAGYRPLDDFLPERFSGRPGRRDADFTRLLSEVAGVTAHFHRLGFNHRDLYCCHFFIRETPPGRFSVNLIDLQRVQRRRWFRRRWLVKDLAQLAYSAPEQVTRTQRMRFIKHYLGVHKLSRNDKRLIRRVLAKQRRMQRHLGAA